ncbi:MAG: hypothetical protein LBQ06_05515 [Frankiaceae bacterium]|nr:hypothetical protein [Frankiaceae bacterium]
MAITTGEDALASLPDTFRHGEALQHVTERQLRSLIASQDVIALARGLYRKADWIGDEDLIEIAAKTPHATLCLRSALARHNLIDDIPAQIDIAVPRGAWTPATIAPVRWRHFDIKTFGIGRERHAIDDERSIGIYNARRSIIDAFRLRQREGPDMANAALKRWLRSGGQPSELTMMARHFPRALTAIRQTLEILL